MSVVRPTTLLGVVVAFGLAACGGETDAEPSASPTTATATAQDTATPTPISTSTPTDGDGAVDAPPATVTPSDSTGGGGDEDVARSAAAVDLARARQSWAVQDGRLYVWAYREEGEGLVDEFCVEGVVGAAASDAAACPFEATPGGRSVESWHDTIAAVLTDAAATGRTVSVVYDETDGHPLEMEFAGGEIDGLLVTTTSMTLDDDVDGVDGQLGELTAGCATGDPDACFLLGVAGGRLPDALATGNEITQAPDLAVLDRCGLGEPAACHEVGARGLAGD